MLAQFLPLNILPNFKELFINHYLNEYYVLLCQEPELGGPGQGIFNNSEKNYNHSLNCNSMDSRGYSTTAKPHNAMQSAQILLGKWLNELRIFLHNIQHMMLSLLFLIERSSPTHSADEQIQEIKESLHQRLRAPPVTI